MFTPNGLNHQIEERVAALREAHPEVEFTFGYIGNVRGLQPSGDDRSWAIFTQISDRQSARRRWGWFRTDELSEMLESLDTPRFEAWLKKTVELAAPAMEKRQQRPARP